MEDTKKNRIVGTISLTGLRLNIFVLLLTFPFWLLISGPFVFMHGISVYAMGIAKVVDYRIFIILVLGIVIHELLHALTWALLQKEGFGNIRFGFNWQSLTPYTHYKKPMLVWKYRWGGFMPGLLMGILPGIVSYIIVSASLNFVSFLFVWAATGDIISLYLIRKLDGKQQVLDHPDKLGVEIINDDPN